MAYQGKDTATGAGYRRKMGEGRSKGGYAAGPLLGHSGMRNTGSAKPLGTRWSGRAGGVPSSIGGGNVFPAKTVGRTS